MILKEIFKRILEGQEKERARRGIVYRGSWLVKRKIGFSMGYKLVK